LSISPPVHVNDDGFVPLGYIDKSAGVELLVLFGGVLL
jgi:hypothetical protein